MEDTEIPTSGPRQRPALPRPTDRRREILGLLLLGLLVTAAGLGRRLDVDLPIFSSLRSLPIAAVQAPTLRAFTLVAEEFDWQIMPGVTVRVWGYNGQVPGPELRVREGDRVRVTLVNRLPVGTTVHWHGLHVDPAMDGPVGLNQAAVEPGQEFVYEFTADPAGSRWYHAHADTKLQIALGLYGPLVVEPRPPARAYDRDYTYILNEWDFELTPEVATGRAPLGPRDAMLRGGELGTDFFLVNGRAHESIPPIVLAAGELVLIRLMNAGNLPHAIHTHGHSFKIVATDGNPVPPGMELIKDTVLIGPGERYDLELTGDHPGVWMLHCHMENHADNGMMTLIQYNGAVPTGPAAAFFDPTGRGARSAAGAAMGHHHSSPVPAPATDDPAATTAVADPEQATTAAMPPAGPGPAAPTVLDEPAVEVTLVDDRFEPPMIEVAAGTTVSFVNRGSNWHSVAGLDGSFASGRIEPATSFAVRFDQPGEYQIICRHHLLRGMTGKIVVRA